MFEEDINMDTQGCHIVFSFNALKPSGSIMDRQGKNIQMFYVLHTEGTFVSIWIFFIIITLLAIRKYLRIHYLF
jgi:hypothetical protein